MGWCRLNFIPGRNRNKFILMKFEIARNFFSKTSSYRQLPERRKHHLVSGISRYPYCDHFHGLTSHKVCWHDDVIKGKHFPRYWPFVRGIHRWPVNSPFKGQWCGCLMFSMMCAWTNGWSNRDAGDLRCHRAHYVVILMESCDAMAGKRFPHGDLLWTHWLVGDAAVI